MVFLSDNGGATNNTADNSPLRGHKGSMWEGGLRVPFALQWPGVIPAGIDFHEPVISLDILPTIAARAGIEATPGKPFDGVDLVPYLTGEKTGAPHESLKWRMFHNGDYAIRRGDLKLVRESSDGVESALFDVVADPAESHPIPPVGNDPRSALRREWEQWESELKPQAFPTLSEEWWPTEE